NSGHNDIGGTCYRGFVQEHIGALELLGLHSVEVLLFIISEFGTKIYESLKMGIQAAPSYFISPGFWYITLAITCQEGAYQHNGSTKTTPVLLKPVRLQILQIYIISNKGIGTFSQLLNLYTKVPKKGNQFIYI